MWTDLWRLLTDWLRQNPEIVAAFLLGILATVTLLIYSWFWLRKPSSRDTELALRFRNEELERETSQLRQQNADLRLELRQLQQSYTQARSETASLRERLQASLREVQQLHQQLVCAQTALEQSRQRELQDREIIRALSEELEGARESQQQYLDALHQVKTERDSLRQRLEARQSLEQFDGRIWQRQPVENSPAFVPLTRRRMRILAMVNLKGGVGKTTLAAYLGAALCEMGLRVLLVDLDYQGSLSALCLGTRYEEAWRSRLLVDNFLRLQEPCFEELRRRVLVPDNWCDQSGAYHVVAAEDTLQPTEELLLTRWLEGRSDMDVRLILRRALHDPAAWPKYDFVLLDCPPRLSTACINALCCCDYVLIPTRLDKLSANGVIRVLRTLKILARGSDATFPEGDHTPEAVPAICPHLEVLAVVPNFVIRRNNAPIRAQAAILNSLPKQCQDSWGGPVFVWPDGIPESAQFSTAELRTFFTRSRQGLGDYFRDLAQGLLLRMKVIENARSGIAAICAGTR
jgi:cellulose biosynthesis protein BcsQ